MACFGGVWSDWLQEVGAVFTAAASAQAPFATRAEGLQHVSQGSASPPVRWMSRRDEGLRWLAWLFRKPGRKQPLRDATKRLQDLFNSLLQLAIVQSAL